MCMSDCVPFISRSLGITNPMEFRGEGTSCVQLNMTAYRVKGPNYLQMGVHAQPIIHMVESFQQQKGITIKWFQFF